MHDEKDHQHDDHEQPWRTDDFKFNLCRHLVPDDIEFVARNYAVEQEIVDSQNEPAHHQQRIRTIKKDLVWFFVVLRVIHWVLHIRGQSSK